MIFDMSAGMGGGKKYLYQAGDERTAVTGGWKASDRTPSAIYVVTARTPTLTKSSAAMTIKLTSAQTNYEGGSVETANTIDLTHASTLTFQITDISLPLGYTDYGKVCLYVTSDTTSQRFTAAAYKVCDAAGAHSIDVSSLSGKYQVGAAIVTANDAPNTVSVTISHVQLS